jgi:hypothetical protein
VEPAELMEGVTPDDWIHRGRLALRLMQVLPHCRHLQPDESFSCSLPQLLQSIEIIPQNPNSIQCILISQHNPTLSGKKIN